MQVVQHVALAIQRRFGRVQILRLFAGTQGAASESDHFSRLVVDGKHQAAAKTIIEAGGLLSLGDESRLLQLLRREARFKLPNQLITGRIGEAEAELGDVFGRYVP